MFGFLRGRQSVTTVDGSEKSSHKELAAAAAAATAVAVDNELEQAPSTTRLSIDTVSSVGSRSSSSNEVPPQRSISINSRVAKDNQKSPWNMFSASRWVAPSGVAHPRSDDPQASEHEPSPTSTGSSGKGRPGRNDPRFTGGSVEFRHTSDAEDGDDSYIDDYRDYERVTGAAAAMVSTTMDDISLSAESNGGDEGNSPPLDRSARSNSQRRRRPASESQQADGGQDTDTDVDLVEEAMLRARQAQLLEAERQEERNHRANRGGGLFSKQLSGRNVHGQVQTAGESSGSLLVEESTEIINAPRGGGRSRTSQHGAVAEASLLARGKRQPLSYSQSSATPRHGNGKKSYVEHFQHDRLGSESYGELRLPSNDEEEESQELVSPMSGWNETKKKKKRMNRSGSGATARQLRRKQKQKKKKEPGEMICGWGAPGTGDTDTDSIGSLGILSNAELDSYFHELYGDDKEEDDASSAGSGLGKAEKPMSSVDAKMMLRHASDSAAKRTKEGRIASAAHDAPLPTMIEYTTSVSDIAYTDTEQQHQNSISTSMEDMYYTTGLNDEVPQQQQQDELEPKPMDIGENAGKPLKLRRRKSLKAEMICGWGCETASQGTNSVGCMETDPDLSASDEDAEAGGKLYFSSWKNRVQSSENLKDTLKKVQDHEASGEDFVDLGDDFSTTGEENDEKKKRQRDKAKARRSLEMVQAVRDIEAMAFMQIRDEGSTLGSASIEGVGTLETNTTGSNSGKEANREISSNAVFTGDTDPKLIMESNSNVQAAGEGAVYQKGTTLKEEEEEEEEAPSPAEDNHQGQDELPSSFSNPSFLFHHQLENNHLNDEDVFVLPMDMSLREAYSSRLGDIDECGESQCSSMRSILSSGVVGNSDRSLAHSIHTRESSARSLHTRESSARSLHTRESSARSIMTRDSSGRSLTTKDTSPNCALSDKEGDVEQEEQNKNPSRRSSLNIYDLTEIPECEEEEEESISFAAPVVVKERKRCQSDSCLSECASASIETQERRSSLASKASRRNSTGSCETGEERSPSLSPCDENTSDRNTSKEEGHNSCPSTLKISTNEGGHRSCPSVVKSAMRTRSDSSATTNNNEYDSNDYYPAHHTRGSMVSSRNSSTGSTARRLGSIDTTVSLLSASSVTEQAQRTLYTDTKPVNHKMYSSIHSSVHSSVHSTGQNSLEGSTISFSTPRSNNGPKRAGRQAVIVKSDEMSYRKKVVPKSDGVKQVILKAMETNILFKTCSEEELVDILDVFEPADVPAGKIVIKQGDEGNHFYVMEKGVIDVYESDKHICALYSGTGFGEIALLYGCPRSATLRARYECKLWSIDRRSYRGIIGQFKRKRLEIKIAFLKRVAINDKKLGDVLSPSEITAMATATREDVFEKGEAIIREGEEGDVFYMIDSGDVDVFIKAKGEDPVVTLGSGQFFGEKALLSNDKRTATCIARTDVKCLILMREDFVQMLGDLGGLMNGSYRNRDSLVSTGSDCGVDSAATWENSLPDIHLNDFNVKRELGVGAFGSVKLVKARNNTWDKEATDSYYALKCISKKLVEDSGLTNHILNEKSVMSQLSHPFIVRFVSAIQDTQNIYFLLECLLGGELCDMLHDMEKFPEEWAQFYSASVIFAFCHMHSRKIAYRDLKPENLVLDHRGYVKIVDFGLAKKVKDGKTWTWCGTPDYLAPEIILNEGHDWAVDYWALGILLVELCSGDAPFADDNPMEVYQKILAGSYNLPPSVSMEFSDLVSKLLVSNPSKRLGRTLGGGGAVLQHKWFASIDCDALLERRIAVPYLPPPRNPEDPGFDDEQSIYDMSCTSGSMALKGDGPRFANGMAPKKNHRISYSLGQGNRHHNKLFQIMQNRQHEGLDPKESAAERADVARKTVIKLANQRRSKTFAGTTTSRRSSLVPSIASNSIPEESVDIDNTSIVSRVGRRRSNSSLGAIMAACVEAGVDGGELHLPEQKKRNSIEFSMNADLIEEALKDGPAKRSSIGAMSNAKMIEEELNKSQSKGEKLTIRRRSTGKFSSTRMMLDDIDNEIRKEEEEGKKEDTLDSFLKVQLMNLSLAVKAERTKREGVAFDHFSLISVKPETLAQHGRDGFEEEIFPEGTRYLDPFAVQSVDLIDKFPNTTSEDDALEPEALSAFCFPNGIKLRLIPRAAMHGAMRIGLLGKESDEYMLHGFTDVTGSLSHGIAITMWDEIDMNRDTPEVIMYLAKRRAVRRSCRVITRSFRRYVQRKHEAATLIVQTWKMYRANCISAGAGRRRVSHRMSSASGQNSGRISRRSSHNIGRRSSQHSVADRRGSQQILQGVVGKWMRHMSIRSSFNMSEAMSGSSDDDFDISIDSIGEADRAALKRRSFSYIDEALSEEEDSGDECEAEASSGDFCTWNQSAITAKGNHSSAETEIRANNASNPKRKRKQKVYPERVRRRAIESYKAMLASDRNGDVCLVQRCYVVIGTSPEEQSLVLCALQQIIDLEREDNTVNRRLSQLELRGHASLSNSFRRGSDFRRSSMSERPPTMFHPTGKTLSARLSFFSENRHSILMALQTKLRLSPKQARVKLPRDVGEYRRCLSNQRFELDMPIGRFKKIELPLPLPQMSGQWGFTKLLLSIQTSDLIMLLKLLLMERSLLIIGMSSDEVTTCAFALLELLSPYKWASAFMPILPLDMIDFVSSPVPFIAGIVVDNPSELVLVEQDERVKAAMSEGLNVLNLSSGVFLITNEFGIDEMLRRAATPTTQLAFYQARVRQLASNESSALNSFGAFFRKGPTTKESLTLQSMKNIIKQYLQGFAGPLLEHPDTWKLFGDYNEATNTFDFCPDKFLQPLKDQMIFQLQFQEMMAHTQLFVGFVEEMQRHCETRHDLLDSSQAQLIADWSSYKWLQYKKRHRQQQQSHVCNEDKLNVVGAAMKSHLAPSTCVDSSSSSTTTSSPTEN